MMMMVTAMIMIIVGWVASCCAIGDDLWGGQCARPQAFLLSYYTSAVCTQRKTKNPIHRLLFA
jgi:hypothetical protein